MADTATAATEKQQQQHYNNTSTDTANHADALEKASSHDSSHADVEKTDIHKHGAEGTTVADDAPPQQRPAGPGPPPDGGLVAWLQVVGGWMLFFNTWGLLNTFGVYQTYYEDNPYWSASSSAIAWIGSVQAVMVLAGGLVVGPIYDQGYLRSLLLGGTFFVVFGHMMLSLTRAFWQVILAQGMCIGFGASMLFIPALAVLPSYFQKNLGLAVGLAASGSSMGGIIYPIMFYKLVAEVGFPWAVRILGFTVLATLAIPNVVLKMRAKPQRVRAFFDPTVFTDWPFLLFVFGLIIGFVGLYVAIFYTSFFGLATGLTDESLSFYLVPILNAGSVLGRTLPNWLSDKLGPFNVITPGALMVGVILLCYIAVVNAGGLIVVTLLFGFFSGIFIAMPPVLFVALTKDKSKIGTRIGMGFFFAAAGVFLGGPAGGAIIGQGTNPKDLHFKDAWIYGGVCALGSGAIFAALRVSRGGLKMKKV